jgi:hypothetical protein
MKRSAVNRFMFLIFCVLLQTEYRNESIVREIHVLDTQCVSVRLLKVVGRISSVPALGPI